MAVIVMASVAGAPGVTTSAVALTFAWHRPMLLVEADISKTSAVLPGYLRGQYDHSRGMTHLAVAQRNNQLNAAEIMSQRIDMAEGKSVILGFNNIVAGQGTTALWGELGTTLSTMDGAGMDVIVDLGRLAANDVRTPLLQMADSVLLVMRPVLPEIAAAAAQVPALQETLTLAGHRDHLEVLLVEAPFETWSRSEIAKVLNVNVATEIKHDPRGAAVYFAGMTKPNKFERSGYQRSIVSAQATITQRMAQRDEELGLRPQAKEATA